MDGDATLLRVTDAEHKDMDTINWTDPIWELVARFTIDTIAMIILVFGMYYRRYRDKELTTAAAMFNIFAFAVLTVLSSVEFSIAAGFGLFAILALFSLRSEQISKIEISYFFGSIAIAVICSWYGFGLCLSDRHFRPNRRLDFGSSPHSSNSFGRETDA